MERWRLEANRKEREKIASMTKGEILKKGYIDSIFDDLDTFYEEGSELRNSAIEGLNKMSVKHLDALHMVILGSRNIEED